MDKRDLQIIVKDANWKKLHSVIRKESDTHVRSTIDRLIDVFAELRMNDLPMISRFQTFGKDGLFIYPQELCLLIMFQGGEYKESICITKTHHIKRYIQQIAPTITEDEVEEVKSTLYKEGVWTRGDITLRFEHKKILSN